MNKSKLHIVMKAHEKEYILLILNKWKWNKPKTAKALGIGISSLYRKITELGIRKPLRRIPQTKGEAK